MNYYNDNDPKVAAWLRELIKQNLVPAGDVDERSIEDVTGADLKGYTQCHFFAGIGGWSEALRLAGWPADRPVWTGSCPCQPFSSAGKRQGEKDKRHLWPEFYRLIRECKPNVIFGEQVERAVGMGWLDRVFADLEVEGYTCGAAVLGAHSVGAPHIRQRLYWVADSQSERWNRSTGMQGQNRRDVVETGGEVGWVADTDGQQINTTNQERLYTKPGGGGEPNFWSNSIIIPCRDGKTRRISPEPAFFPLADGIPGRVAMLRGFGNAIVPQVAAEFIKAYEECLKGDNT